jgi:hypothetical protein
MQKWHNMCRKAGATTTGTWTVEEENKLASTVATFGTSSWATLSANIPPGRSENQCCKKWHHMLKKAGAGATTTGAWTAAKVNKLASAVATFGTTSKLC